jgi:hypothetical protein
MKFRWVTYYNKVLSMTVREYAEENNLSLNEAGDILVDKVGPTLEYWDGRNWLEVEHEMISRGE